MRSPAYSPVGNVSGVAMAVKTITLEAELLKSEVYRSLSGAQKNMLNDFLMKRKLSKHKGTWQIVNNGDIVYTYDEGKLNGIKRSNFMKCLDALIAKGFIDVYHSGNGGKKGDVSLYWISDRWKKFGTLAFVVKERPKDSRCKRGFAAHPDRRKKNISTQKCS
jgi:hypothetical protein